MEIEEFFDTYIIFLVIVIFINSKYDKGKCLGLIFSVVLYMYVLFYLLPTLSKRKDINLSELQDSLKNFTTFKMLTFDHSQYLIDPHHFIQLYNNVTNSVLIFDVRLQGKFYILSFMLICLTTLYFTDLVINLYYLTKKKYAEYKESHTKTIIY